jgi:hypothetical protein
VSILIEIYQVGRTNKNGTPVKRERKAMADIENATNIKVIFIALKIVLILLAIGAITFAINT